VSQASRRNRDAWRHQPSPPGDFMAGTARCASRGCRQVFGLVDMEASLPPRPLLPGAAHQCVSRLRFHLPLRGSAGIGSQEPHRLPFSSDGASRRNRQTQHSVVADVRQHDMWSFLPPPTDYSGDLNMVNQVSRQPRASRRSWNIASGSLSMLPVYYSLRQGGPKRASERATVRNKRIIRCVRGLPNWWVTIN